MCFAVVIALIWPRPNLADTTSTTCTAYLPPGCARALRQPECPTCHRLLVRGMSFDVTDYMQQGHARKSCHERESILCLSVSSMPCDLNTHSMPACGHDTPSGIFQLRLSCVPLNERLQHLATEPSRLLLPLAVLLTAVPMSVHTKGAVHSAGGNTAHVGTDCPLLPSLLCKNINGCAIAALPLQR